MSAAAVVGAGLLYPLMKKYVRRRSKTVRTFWQKQKRLLMDSFLACTAINLTTLPLVPATTVKFRCMEFPVNILLLPPSVFVTCPVPGSLVGMAGGMCMFISKIILLPASSFTNIWKIMNLVRLLPGAMWICGQPKDLADSTLLCKCWRQRFGCSGE